MTQGELEKLPLSISKAFSELEIRIMSDIVRRIKENGFSTATSDWEIARLQQLGTSEADIKKWVQEALKATDEEMERIFSDEVFKQYTGYERAYKASGQKQLALEENEPLQQLIAATKEQLAGEYENLAASMGFAIRGSNGKITYSPLMEYYRNTLDAAVMDIQSGAFSYQAVLNRTVNQLTSSGLRWIDFDSGHHNRVDVAARRAVMTGFRQVQGKINEQVAADLKTDSYEVTYHVGARPSHQPWQGKVWTMAQLQSVCGLGTVTGLHGANCYHDYNAFIPGVSVRTYTDEQLEEMMEKENEPKTYLGKQYTTYEALQYQRKMETTMRKYRQDIKLLQEGGSSNDDIILKKAKYQGKLQEYETFSRKMGLPMQKERIYQDGLIGKFSLTKAEKKKLEEKQKNDIIKSELKALGLRGKLNLTPAKINSSELAFDETHINKERSHSVSFNEAKSFIANALFSETVWNGQFERYYSEAGAAYVRTSDKFIRTAFKKEEYSQNILDALEVVKKHGK